MPSRPDIHRRHPRFSEMNSKRFLDFARNDSEELADLRGHVWRRSEDRQLTGEIKTRGE
jgi:hypothetical protein